MQIRNPIPAWLVLVALSGCGGGGSGGSSLTYSISGAVTDLSSGKPVTDVTMAISGTKATTSSTSASGSYEATGLPGGTYTVTPTVGLYKYLPATMSVTLDGSDRGGVNFTRQSFIVSGHVTNALTGAPRAQVSVALSGPVPAATATDANGQYSVAELPNGSYTVTASATGVAIGPSLLAVTVNDANATGQDFVAAVETTIASGISFLPATRISSDPIPHAALAVSGGNVFFSDASATPLKKVTLSNLAVTPMALRMSAVPQDAVIYGQSVYWRNGDSLYQTSMDGATTIVLASGLLNPAVDNVPADLAVDADAVFFVDAASYPNCNGSCPWHIERVARSGGSPVVLASTNRRVVALTTDAANVYWEEASLEPISLGCMCGSSINRVAKSGGAPTQLVDGMLNGPLPDPGGGYIPGSWMPTGGIVVDSSRLYFGVSGYYGLTGYQVSSVPIVGGAVSALAIVPSSALDALNAIRSISVSAGTVYWIDMISATLDAVPSTGGVATALANVTVTDMAHPASLAIAAGRAFWTEPGTFSGCCMMSGSGSIRSVPLSGGSPSLVYGNLDAPTWLTTDGTALVWTEAWRIVKAPASGGLATSLATGIATNMPRLLADDKFVYVLDGDLVKKVSVTGGKLQRVAAAELTMGELGLHDEDIVSDGINLYWTVTDMFYNSKVYTAAVAGGPTTLLATPATGLLGGPNLPTCFGRVAVDTQYVYWMSASAITHGGCSVARVPLAGGAAQVVADGADLQDFTIDASHLYIARARTPIQQMPLAGGPSTEFSPSIALELINDAANVYWLSSGALWRQSKNSSGAAANPTLVPVGVATQPAIAMEALVGDGNGLFLTSTVEGKVYRVQ
jgi:hypothetical protein